MVVARIIRCRWGVFILFWLSLKVAIWSAAVPAALD
jgi:hypothetical protein